MLESEGPHAIRDADDDTRYSNVPSRYIERFGVRGGRGGLSRHQVGRALRLHLPYKNVRPRVSSIILQETEVSHGQSVWHEIQ